MFPDIEMVLADLLTQFVPNASHTGTYTGSDLAGLLPFIRVNRFGGGDDGITDRPAVDIDYFASTRTAAINLARQCHQFLISGPHLADGVLIDAVTGDTGPRELPWNDGAIRRFGGSYTVSVRRVHDVDPVPPSTTAVVGAAVVGSSTVG